MYSELHAQVIQSSSIRPIVLRLLLLIISCSLDSLSLTRMPLILFSSCLVLYDVTARCVRMSNRRLLIIFTPGLNGHIPGPRSIRALLYSRTRFLSAILSLYVFIQASPAKVLSILASPAKVLSRILPTWFCRLSLPKKQRISRTTSHVSVSFNIRIQDVEFSTLNFQRFIDQHSWMIFSLVQFHTW